MALGGRHATAGGGAGRYERCEQRGRHFRSRGWPGCDARHVMLGNPKRALLLSTGNVCHGPLYTRVSSPRVTSLNADPNLFFPAATFCFFRIFSHFFEAPPDLKNPSHPKKTLPHSPRHRTRNTYHVCRHLRHHRASRPRGQARPLRQDRQVRPAHNEQKKDIFVALVSTKRRCRIPAFNPRVFIRYAPAFDLKLTATNPKTPSTGAPPASPPRPAPPRTPSSTRSPMFFPPLSKGRRSAWASTGSVASAASSCAPPSRATTLRSSP